ncbi:MAG: T9SS type A sorting domain-containing protein [Bacteroidota bacterium]
MKKTLLLFFIVLCGFAAQSQTYAPFPETDAVWNGIRSFNYKPDPSIYCLQSYRYSIVMSGDTVIGSNNYHKIKESGYYIDDCFPPGNYYYNEYKGALRQDSLQKKVFFCPTGSSLEEVLYDFNLNVGDTLPNWYVKDNNAFVQSSNNMVTDIDSVLVGSQFHKRFILFNITPYGSSYSLGDTTYALIEGVGGTDGLLYGFSKYYFIYRHMYCFEGDDLPYPANSHCLYDVSTPEITNYKSGCSVYPNPVTDNILIITTTDLATIRILNIHGQLMKTISSNTNKTSVDISAFPSGLYLVEVKTNTGIEVRKFVKE